MAAKHQTVEEYENNMLIAACGPIPSNGDLARKITRLPPLPSDIGQTEHQVRLHQLGRISNLHVPTPQGIKIATTIDYALRQSYVHRAPNRVATWRKLYAGEYEVAADETRPLVASIFGVSGTGKSKAIERALAQYRQVVIHEKFPGMAGPFKQVLWLKIDVPGTGKSVDLAEQLMMKLDQALGSSHFESDLTRSKKNGPQMLRAWLQKAQSHFLGVLVLDEVQNLFKLAPVRARRKNTADSDRALMRVVDDETLKFILTLANSSGPAIVAAGTPDGMAAFNSRFSTSQRMTTVAYHFLSPIESVDDLYYSKYLLPALTKYQWLEEPMEGAAGLERALFDHAGGVPRIMINLWQLSQRCAIERRARALRLSDLETAMNTYMAPVKPAVAALKSSDPWRLKLYEDLYPRYME